MKSLVIIAAIAASVISNSTHAGTLSCHVQVDSKSKDFELDYDPKSNDTVTFDYTFEGAQFTGAIRRMGVKDAIFIGLEIFYKEIRSTATAASHPEYLFGDATIVDNGRVISSVCQFGRP